jgi:hypothetical protein
MTSKEALDELYAGNLAQLHQKDLCELPETKERKYLDDLYQNVEKDLELLEILKKYTMLDKDFGNFHINTYPCSEDEGKKVKEWLRNE